MDRRLSYEDLVASPRRRRHHRRVQVLHQRQYPARQARCLLLGLLGLPACSARMFCAAGILRMASAKGKLTFRLALKQTVICMWSSLSGHPAAPGVKEATALGQGCRRGAHEEKDGGPGLARQEEGRRVPEGQEPQRGGPDGGECVRSAFRRLMVNGVVHSFVPRPGPLRGDFCAKPAQRGAAAASQAGFLSSCSKRNAITSSYSSTRGLPAPRLPAPAARPPRAPAEKAGGESPASGDSVPAEPLGKVAQEAAAGVAVEQKPASGRSPAPAADDGRPRRRRFPLLLPARRDSGWILPSPPQLGYRVSAEDLDLEKRAALQWIHKALEG